MRLVAKIHGIGQKREGGGRVGEGVKDLPYADHGNTDVDHLLIEHGNTKWLQNQEEIFAKWCHQIWHICTENSSLCDLLRSGPNASLPYLDPSPSLAP